VAAAQANAPVGPFTSDQSLAADVINS
jgi:hypothetical protein